MEVREVVVEDRSVVTAVWDEDMFMSLNDVGRAR